MKSELCRTSLYRAWVNIIQRCCNPNDPHYRYYGGRGITICDRWRHSFAAFRDDVGERPDKTYSIDRINNDLGYEPSNVRWATRHEQVMNRRNARYIDIDGIRMPLKEAAAMRGVHYDTARLRIKLGQEWDKPRRKVRT